MDITTLGTVVGIVAICYVIGLGCKAYEKIPDKWIPVIMAVCGGALGVAGLYTMPDFPAGDVINAIAVGMASGLAATGVNQLYKRDCDVPQVPLCTLKDNFFSIDLTDYFRNHKNSS